MIRKAFKFEPAAIPPFLSLNISVSFISNVVEDSTYIGSEFGRIYSWPGSGYGSYLPTHSGKNDKLEAFLRKYRYVHVQYVIEKMSPWLIIKLHKLYRLFWQKGRIPPQTRPKRSGSDRICHNIDGRWWSIWSLTFRASNPDPDRIRLRSGQFDLDPGPGMQKLPTKVEIFGEISCFEVLDALFWELRVSLVTLMSFMEA